MIAPPKILFIGLDAADPALLAQGCDAGWLPVLQNLRRNGAWAQVTVPRGFGDGAIWPSLFTGVNPGRHGRYFYRQLKLGTYESEDFVQDTGFGHKPLWEYLSQADRRVAVIDIVKGPHSKDINGDSNLRLEYLSIASARQNAAFTKRRVRSRRPQGS